MNDPTPYSGFIQEVPGLNNEYTDDQFLQDYLSAYFPADRLAEIRPDLEQFGKRVAGEMLDWANACEVHLPKLVQYDASGKRVDEIKVAPEWLKLERVAAEDGLVAIGYERQFGAYSRLYQFVKLYLYTPSSAIYTCPLAMTDGAARLIELYGNAALKAGAWKALTSRDPQQFKTSGQWMTERTGGSDISRSMTFAYPDGEGYLLKGHKWFTSAITADMAFTLATTEQPAAGKRAPLSLFYLPIRHEDGTLNGIEVEALKDKLGTKALPTAQLSLTGAKAILVGEKGKGVRTIATLFNITRIYNTISAVSYMRRAFSLSKAYGESREAFGKKIGQHILYRNSLRELEIAYQSNTLLALFLARLLGREECGQASGTDTSLLRLLTPVAKLYTAKQSIKSASEHIEMFGGLGYLEDSNIPVMLRNAQVLSIWEGTTNVLSLDMLRAMEKEQGWEAFTTFAKSMLSEIHQPTLQEQKRQVADKISVLENFVAAISAKEGLESCSRDIAFYLAEAAIALLWLDLLQRGPEKKEYTAALDYWIQYRMNAAALEAYTYLHTSA